MDATTCYRRGPDTRALCAAAEAPSADGDGPRVAFVIMNEMTTRTRRMTAARAPRERARAPSPVGVMGETAMDATTCYRRGPDTRAPCAAAEAPSAGGDGPRVAFVIMNEMTTRARRMTAARAPRERARAPPPVGVMGKTAMDATTCHRRVRTRARRARRRKPQARTGTDRASPSSS